MNISNGNVKSILRAIYVLTFAVLLNMALSIYFYVNPRNGALQKAEQKEFWKPKSISHDLPEGELGEQIRYGYQLVTETSTYIGPNAIDIGKRFSGNNLACNNCHLDAGRKIGSGAFIGVTNRYPQFRARENTEGNIYDRINGCMERSMNGTPMPESSQEMQAFVAYMSWLSEDVPDEIAKLYKGYTTIKLPSFMADTTMGKTLYAEKCIHCHMNGGLGLKKIGDSLGGYIYPPLSGADTYNDGAGMNRVITAAQFIKGNMPFGATYDAPRVTDEEAYHLAAYINTLPRPVKANKELDFPDKKLKPVSTPYGPWTDDFTPLEHKFGPFPPIIAYYKKKYDLIKTK